MKLDPSNAEMKLRFVDVSYTFPSRFDWSSESKYKWITSQISTSSAESFLHSFSWWITCTRGKEWLWKEYHGLFAPLFRDLSNDHNFSSNFSLDSSLLIRDKFYSMESNWKITIRRNGGGWDQSAKEILKSWYFQMVGVVSQEPSLFYGSIKDNICLGRPFTDEQVEEACRVAYAHEFIMGLEEVREFQWHIYLYAANDERIKLNFYSGLLHPPRPIWSGSFWWSEAANSHCESYRVQSATTSVGWSNQCTRYEIWENCAGELWCCFVNYWKPMML